MFSKKADHVGNSRGLTHSKLSYFLQDSFLAKQHRQQASSDLSAVTLRVASPPSVMQNKPVFRYYDLDLCHLALRLGNTTKQAIQALDLSREVSKVVFVLKG